MHEWADTEQVIDLPEVGWLTDPRSRARFATVANLVPRVYERYARILHPPYRTVDAAAVEYLSWSEVARMTNSIAHPRMQWESISPSVTDGLPAELQIEGPSRSNFTPDFVIDAIAEVLPGGRCYFAVWEGNTALHGVNSSVPKAEINGDRFHLLAGPAANASKVFHGLRPNIWWNADRSWFVASNTDLDSTYLGASSATVTELLRSSVVEAWEVDPDDDVSRNGDELNRRR